MTEPLSISDPKLRDAIRQALARTGELLVLIRHIYGLREWWLVTNLDELDRALGRAGTTNGTSDAIEVYATGELRFRSADKDMLRQQALAVLADSDVVLACQHDGDPELHDVEETDNLRDVDKWLAGDREGQLMIGSHPLLKQDDFYPHVDNVFLAYVPLPDGTVKPGSY